MLLGPGLRHQVAQPGERKCARVQRVGPRQTSGAIPHHRAGEPPQAAPVERACAHFNPRVIERAARFDAVAAAGNIDRVPEHCAVIPVERGVPRPGCAAARRVKCKAPGQFFAGMQARGVGESGVGKRQLSAGAGGRITHQPADASGIRQNAFPEQGRDPRQLCLIQLKPRFAIGQIERPALLCRRAERQLQSLTARLVNEFKRPRRLLACATTQTAGLAANLLFVEYKLAALDIDVLELPVQDLEHAGRKLRTTICRERNAQTARGPIAAGDVVQIERERLGESRRHREQCACHSQGKPCHHADMRSGNWRIASALLQEKHLSAASRHGSHS